MAFRIVQVVQEFSTQGGVETVAWELQRAWDAAGVPATVIASAHAEVPEGTRLCRVAGGLARIPTRGAWRHLGRLLVVPAFTLAATAALRRERDAAVLSHGDTLAGDVLVVHAVNKASLQEKRREGGLAGLRWAANPMHLWVAARDRWMIGGLRFRYYVAVSRRVTAELTELYGVPADRIRVIPNGIDPDRFRPVPGAAASVRAEFGIPPEARLLLFAGHEFERKGLAHAVDALGHLPEGVHLLVVGAGDADPYRRQTGPDLLRRIHFAGARRDMPRLYTAADAFVFPTAYESFSLVCMEAMACGVPVFAARAGGIEDYVESGVNGYLVPRDGAGIAAVLGPALADAAKLAQLRDGALATARRYGWPEIASRYAALLRDALQERAQETARRRSRRAVLGDSAPYRP